MTLKTVATLAFAVALSSCGNFAGGDTSKATGWQINGKKGGLKYNTSFDEVETPIGMVEIEGGTFTMGRVEDDVLGEWNNVPTQQYVNTFFMDETEVTNLMYVEYLAWLKAVYPPSEPNYKGIYTSALPDTLVWKKHLGFAETLTTKYLRHPAYSAYPVVGVSWVQANDYSQWRTDRVNELALENAGYLRKNSKVRDAYGSNSFSTDAYLTAPSKVYGGNDSIVFRGRKNKAKEDAKRVYLTEESGLFVAEYRLPTEAEWEYAASVSKSDREYNNQGGRSKYPWGTDNVKSTSRSTKGDYLANFKQNRGDYGGIAGWAGDKGELTSPVKSFPPNDWGLYDMAGNVAEWVADVYRPEITSVRSDVNYYRGNVYEKDVRDEQFQVVVVDENNVKYDTLPNGKLRPVALPGRVQKELVSKADTYLRRNFNDKNSVDYADGDNLAVINNAKMYNSPENKVQYDGQGDPMYMYDANQRTTLINNNSRVYKGGSWKDRAYWLDPATRRYLDQYQATDFIGFRNAMTKIGKTKTKKRKPRG